MLNIIALRYISLSEIQKTNPEITLAWIENNPEQFKVILFELGLDTSIPWDWQENIPHRNFFNEVVTCDRWVGNERTDKVWIESGNASLEAKDKSKGNKLIIDLYRQRGLVDVE